LLVVAADNAVTLVDEGLGKLLRGPHQLRVAWEPLAGGGRREEDLRAHLKTTTGKEEVSEVWLYREHAVGERTPRLLDPASAADVWQRHSG
jgi:hypothetical protein